jgi:hypothetical protein
MVRLRQQIRRLTVARFRNIDQKFTNSRLNALTVEIDDVYTVYNNNNQIKLRCQAIGTTLCDRIYPMLLVLETFHL